MGSTKQPVVSVQEEIVIVSNLNAFAETCGVSWEEYANFDHDCSMNRSITEYWETAILEKATVQDALKKHAKENDEE